MLELLNLLLKIEKRIGGGALTRIRTSPFNTLEIIIDWADDFHMLAEIKGKKLEAPLSELEDWIVNEAKRRREYFDHAKREQTQ